jgi:hypothetical protein
MCSSRISAWLDPGATSIGNSIGSSVTPLRQVERWFAAHIENGARPAYRRIG